MNNISTLTTTKHLIAKNRFKTKKHFGQNFLTDSKLIDDIVDSADITANTGVIEIGPGLGALTEKLLKKAKTVLAYEIDNDLIPILNENFKSSKNFVLLNKDILKSDVNSDINEYLNDCDEVIVVANLPYYITTPILMNLIENDLPIKRYITMTQKEVAERLTSKANTKDYNSLSIAIAYRTKGKIVLNVSREAFVPAPNVDSAVIRLDKLDKPSVEVDCEEYFFKVVRSSFIQRRKMLTNNLNQGMGFSKDFIREALDELNISTNIRGEALSIEDFKDLANYLYRHK